jgi:D-alanine transaminase
VLELAEQNSLRCEERELLADELCAAQEVFITSSIRELVPVVRVDEATIGDGKPGPVIGSLLAAYRRRAAAG